MRPLGHSERAGEADVYYYMDEQKGRPATSVAPTEPANLWFVNSADVHAALGCAKHCSGGLGVQQEQTQVPALLELTFLGAADNERDKLVKCRVFSILGSAKEKS